MRRFLVNNHTEDETDTKRQRVEVSDTVVAYKTDNGIAIASNVQTIALLNADDNIQAMNSPTNKWVDYCGIMYKFSGVSDATKTEMVAFDMDGTLIDTKSGKKFAVNESDWKLWDPSVRTVMRQLHAENKYIAIISNQNGIKEKKVTKESVQRKVESIIAEIGVPMDFICCIDDGKFRKPRTGMWEFLCKARFPAAAASASTATGSAALSTSSSGGQSTYLYVGDAAGREKEGTRSKDFSDTDYKLALNLGIKVCFC